MVFPCKGVSKQKQCAALSRYLWLITTAPHLFPALVLLRVSMDKSANLFEKTKIKFIVGCRGVIQLAALVSGYP